MASSIDSINKALTAVSKVSQIASKLSSARKAANPQQHSKKELDRLVAQRVKEALKEKREEQAYHELAVIRSIVKAVKTNDYEQLSIITGLPMEDCIILLKV